MIHLYTGSGKGKTTAAMGLALRAAGAGKKVVVVQFLKGQESCEIQALQALPNVTVLRSGNSEKFAFQMGEEEKAAAKQAHEGNLAKAALLIRNGECGLLVLDEACGALSIGLLGEEPVREIIAACPATTELVFTGRDAPAFLWDAADYITEMQNKRHPYEKGASARKGIEY